MVGGGVGHSVDHGGVVRGGGSMDNGGVVRGRGSMDDRGMVGGRGSVDHRGHIGGWCIGCWCCVHHRGDVRSWVGES